MIDSSSHVVNSTLGDNVIIWPGCRIIDSTIENGVKIEWNVLIEKSIIRAESEILWWSIIRESEINSGCIVGCEVKRSHLGVHTMAKHPWTTLWSLKCGKNNNFWSGVKCANFDGKWKGNFVLGDDVFVGCNTVMSVKADTTRTIGNTVKIWALVHVDRDVPDATLVYVDRDNGKVTYREGYFNNISNE